MKHFCPFPFTPLQELPGHGQSVCVPSPVLVGAVGGFHHWGHQDLHLWLRIPAGLLLLPAVRHQTPGEAFQDSPHLVGLPHHVQCGSHHIEKYAISKYMDIIVSVSAEDFLLSTSVSEK